jgi:hypothetical protein
MSILERNEVILPDKRNAVIDELRNEINVVNDDVRNKRYADSVIQAMQRNADKLQGYLDKFLTKTGVITPTETNAVMDVLASLKKQRMSNEVAKDNRRLMIYGIGFIAIVVAGIILYKKYYK